MTQLAPMITGAKGFDYSDAPQRTKEWFDIRAPRIGASQLGAWLGKGVKGQYLKPHFDLIREISFSKAFGVPFTKYVNDAMRAGVENEDFVADQYGSQMGVIVEKVGCFYNSWFVASPDRLVGEDGLAEIKWLFDSAWSNVVENNEPEPEHYLQMQGQLWATGRKWCDYVAGNGNTGRFIVIRVLRDEEVIAQIAESVKEVDDIESMVVQNVFEFSGNIPAEATNEKVWEDD